MKKIAFLLLFLTGMAQSLLAQTKTSSTGNIISVSDIHFNPYYQYNPALMSKLIASPYTKWQAIFDSLAVKQPNNDYSQDSNYALFKSVLAAMKKQNPAPGFIIITGDFLCHSFVNNFSAYTGGSDSLISFTSKTIQFMALMFKQTYPNTVILPVLGNNDTFCQDYGIQAPGPFLTMFAKAWVPLQHNNNPALDKAFITQFSKGGYYTYALRDGSGGKMVMLNTVLFSGGYNDCGNPYAPPVPGPGYKELNWIDSVLARSKAQNSKVWMAMHIPPGINVYPSIVCDTPTELMYTDTCNKRMLKAIVNNASIIKANFSGHTHMDDFRVYYNAAKAPISFLHVTPAVSPKFGNNAGFQTLTYNKATFSLIDYKTYYLNILQQQGWNLEYDFGKTYGIAAINPQTMNTVRNKIKASTAFSNFYVKYYNVSSPKYGIASTWTSYWCGTGTSAISGFRVCNGCTTPAAK